MKHKKTVRVGLSGWCSTALLAGAAAAQTPIHNIDVDAPETGTYGYAHAIGDIDLDGVKDFGVIRYVTFRAVPEFWFYSGATKAVLHVLPMSIQPGGINFQAIDSAGDLNGDGIDDILAACPQWGIPTVGTSFGRVYVLSGSDLSVLLTLEGTYPQAQLGRDFCTVGDMDQDGLPDYAASTITSNGIGGRVQVFSGATGVIIRQWEEPHGGIGYGHVIACPGDLDSDGYPDLLIGSDGYPTFGSFGDGAAWAVSGRTGNVLYQVSGNPPSVSVDATRFATDLAAFEDIDGDGVMDFMATAVNDNTQGPGLIWVFSGATGAVIHVIPGEFAHPLIFSSAMWFVSAAGDVNGDGVPDLMASHPGAQIDFLVIPGIVRIYSGVDGSKLMQLTAKPDSDPPYNLGETFGESISALDDVDGDGFDDFLVGVKNRITGVHSQLFPGIALDGAVVVYSGVCLAPVSYCSGLPNSTGSAANLGSQGSLSLEANDLALSISGAVPNRFGIFFYGGAAVDLPLGNGRLCVGPGSQGLYRLGAPVLLDGSGSVNFPIDVTQAPMDAGDGELLATSTWYFQFWYRDSAGGGAGFNLSNALEAYFCQ